jgi:copper chaperone CopZ
MKKIFILIAVLVATNSYAQIKKATIQASGLTCAMCSKAIYKALSSVPFVEKIQTDIEHASYDLVFKAGSKVDLDALSKVVADAGFSVSMLKVTTDFNDAKIQNDTHIKMSEQTFHFINVSPQTLNGTKTITVIDKNFVSAKDYKKYGKLTSMPCYESGTMNGQRIYHVTI